MKDTIYTIISDLYLLISILSHSISPGISYASSAGLSSSSVNDTSLAYKHRHQHRAAGFYFISHYQSLITVQYPKVLRFRLLDNVLATHTPRYHQSRELCFSILRSRPGSSSQVLFVRDRTGMRLIRSIRVRFTCWFVRGRFGNPWTARTLSILDVLSQDPLINIWIKTTVSHLSFFLSFLFFFFFFLIPASDCLVAHTSDGLDFFDINTV